MNQIIKLKSVLGTTYIWDAFDRDVAKIFEDALANNDIIDIGACRFGNVFISRFRKFQHDGLRIINSEEEELNEILEHNRNMVANENNNANVRELWTDIHEDASNPKSWKSMTDLIKQEKDKSVIWNFNVENNNIAYNNAITLLSILNLIFPSRIFNCSKPGWKTAVLANWKKHLQTSDYEDETSFVYFYSSMEGAAYPIEYKADGDLIQVKGIGVISKFDWRNTSIQLFPAWIVKGSLNSSPPGKMRIASEILSEIKTIDEAKRILESKTIYGLIKSYGDLSNG